MNPITIETTINSDLQNVWEKWNSPEDITKWSFASDDWECPRATNDLQVGGRFSTTMAAKDGSTSFDFTGTYTLVEPMSKIQYTMDGEGKRKVTVLFEKVSDNQTKVTETFDPENQNPEEMQRGGWQAILENFKKHVEKN